MSKIEEKVENIIKAKIEELGYILYDVEYAKQGKDHYLRVFIDKSTGIDLNDCEKVSNEISGLLDKADCIKEQYYLEVSSPGIERTLRKDEHFKQNIGNQIQISLFAKDENGKKEYKGILESFDKNTINIESENKQIAINRKNISVVKTVYDW